MLQGSVSKSRIGCCCCCCHDIHIIHSSNIFKQLWGCWDWFIFIRGSSRASESNPGNWKVTDNIEESQSDGGGVVSTYSL